MTDLRIAGLTASYDSNRPVLDGLDLTVPEGCLAAVLGPSGCGKTTMLRIVAGFLRPDSGTVDIRSRTVTGKGLHVPPEKRRVGIVPQEGALFPHLTVARNIAFGLPRGASASRGKRVGELLELVGLNGYGSRMPHELSGGQQQRVALARALAPSPAIVLLDEPFNALDSALRAGIRDDVRAALAAAGATGVLVTHDQEEALSSADLVAVMRNGRVVQCGTPHDVYHRPADLWTASFVGDAVRLPGTAQGATVATALGDVQLYTPAPGGTGVAVIRPEQVVLVQGADDAHGGMATVRSVEFHGHHSTVRVGVPGISGVVTARVLGSVPASPGDAVTIVVSGRATWHADGS
ncbi:ABC transporter ATP-binding protein [Streptomyces sp. CS7]|uniref:ABC transporter ATP-binding protein n=1 Tax=Streptomyces sp. CS-7 TaxID=2906769 RepID=UPI0021B49566|nr:ABC transporter ATP-binding protein [Streptomyces sp. CS-7]MCT6782148.1 ABC transporter ATP-binding protein [Streptomyces sp. CS-7]